MLRAQCVGHTVRLLQPLYKTVGLVILMYIDDLPHCHLRKQLKRSHKASPSSCCIIGPLNIDDGSSMLSWCALCPSYSSCVSVQTLSSICMQLKKRTATCSSGGGEAAGPRQEWCANEAVRCQN